MGNQYDLEQAQDRLNRIHIGNLESDLLAGEGWGEGGWVANRPSCRSKWSEGEEACQCFLLYILTCIKLIIPQGWYLHQMELESGYDFPEVVMTTEGVWDDMTFTPNLSLAFLSLYNAIPVVEFNWRLRMRDNCYKAFFFCSPRLWGHAILFPAMRTQQLPTNHNRPQLTKSRSHNGSWTNPINQPNCTLATLIALTSFLVET